VASVHQRGGGRSVTNLVTFGWVKQKLGSVHVSLQRADDPHGNKRLIFPIFPVPATGLYPPPSDRYL